PGAKTVLADHAQVETKQFVCLCKCKRSHAAFSKKVRQKLEYKGLGKGQMVIALSSPAIEIKRKKNLRHSFWRKTLRFELTNGQVAVIGISLGAPETLAK